MSTDMKRNKFVYIFFTAALTAVLIGACQSESQLNYARYYTSGKQLYNTYCQNCHNSDGKGLGTLIPPLTDTVFLRQNKSRLACIIKYGLDEKITVHGVAYDAQMAPNSQLPDIDIAALVTYITNSFGNEQGLYDVSAAAHDLQKCSTE